MSNYGFNNESLIEHKARYTSFCGSAQSAISKATEGFMNIAQTDAIQGNAANNLKEYYSTVYPTILCIVGTALEYFHNCYTEFYGAYRDVDNADDASMTTSCLEEVSSKLSAIAKKATSIESTYRSELSRYPKAVSFNKHSGKPLVSIDTTDILELKKTVDEIIEKIVAVEETFSVTAPGVIDPFIAQCETVLNDLLSHEAKDFSISSFGNSLISSGIISSYELMSAKNAEMRSSVEVIDAAFFELIENRQKEYEARQKSAAFWGTVLDVVCVVVEAGTMIFAPASAPLVFTITGGIKNLGHTLLDQYAETGAILQSDQQWVSALFSTGKGLALGYIEGKIMYKGYLKATTTVAGDYTLKDVGGKLVKTYISPVSKFGAGFAETFSSEMLKTTVGHGFDFTEAVAIGSMSGDYDMVSLENDVRKYSKSFFTESVSNVNSAIFSNVGELIPTKKLSTAKKVLVNLAVDTGTAIEGEVVSSVLNHKEISGSTVLEAGGKGLFKSTIKQTSSHLLSDKSKLGKWVSDPYGSKSKQYTVSTLIGVTDKYLEKNGAKAFGKVITGDYSGAKDALTEKVPEVIAEGAMHGIDKAHSLQEKAQAKENERIANQFYDQNIRKMNLPQSGGKWSDPSKPGNSEWIIDPDATFEVGSGDSKKTLTGKQIKEQYGIDRITYKDSKPDFSSVEDEAIGKVTVDEMPTVRRGSKQNPGSYDLAAQAAAKKFGLDDPSQIDAYMKEHGLTWHEDADRKTISAVPTDINAIFKHTGGISIETGLDKYRSYMEEKYQLSSSGYTLVRSQPQIVSSDFDYDAVKQRTRQLFTQYARAK